MTTFERRQRLLDLIGREPGLRVPEIAERLDVSEGTVRNDLNALARAGQLTRVRGGATLSPDTAGQNATFATRARINETAKRHIARWAAELVQEDDSIFLDASTTVYHIAECLQDRHNLTIITNGIEVARRLAQNPTNTVILLGGILTTDSTSVSGPLSEKFLRELHVKTAIISSSGFALEAGLTEVDIHEAELKREALACADSVIALIDSSKFGKVDLTPFARVEQISQLFTDSDITPRWVDQIKATCLSLTVCNEDTVTVFAPCTPQARHYRIGFANQSEELPFAVDVRRGLERAAKEASNIDLVLADNQLNGQVAMQVAERFIAEKVDLVLEYQIDEEMGNRIMDRFRLAGIPVIAVDIPMVGATFFGVDNYRAGHMAGVALGNWIRNNWGGIIDRLLILEEPRAGALPAARIHGQLDGLRSVIGNRPSERQVRLNSGNTSEASRAQVLEALGRIPNEHRIAVVSFNDDAALGALAAARELHREEDIVIVGQGADRRMREELSNAHTRVIGSTAYQPDKYGDMLIPLALKLLSGEAVPPAVYMDHTFIPAVDQVQVTSEVPL